MQTNATDTLPFGTITLQFCVIDSAQPILALGKHSIRTLTPDELRIVACA